MEKERTNMNAFITFFVLCVSNNALRHRGVIVLIRVRSVHLLRQREFFVLLYLDLREEKETHLLKNIKQNAVTAICLVLIEWLI